MPREWSDIEVRRTRSVRRRRPDLRSLRFVWLACLVAPPALRLWLDYGREPSADAHPSSTWVAASGLGGAELEARLVEAERDIQALGNTLASQDYAPVLARVLPLADPSPRRSSLFVGLRSRRPVLPDTAALTPGHALLGRVVEVIGPPAEDLFAIAQIQTLLDKSFRVRFAARDLHGLAAGTLVTDADGAPLLEILFLDGVRGLVEGEPVVTDDASGIYAPGIRLGTISLDAGQAIPARRNDLPVIRASARHLEALRQVIVLSDLMRLSGAAADEVRAARRAP